MSKSSVAWEGSVERGRNRIPVHVDDTYTERAAWSAFCRTLHECPGEGVRRRTFGQRVAADALRLHRSPLESSSKLLDEREGIRTSYLSSSRFPPLTRANTRIGHPSARGISAAPLTTRKFGKLHDIRVTETEHLVFANF